MVVKYGYWLTKEAKWVGYYQCEDSECRDLFRRIKKDIDLMYVKKGDKTYVWNRHLDEWNLWALLEYKE